MVRCPARVYRCASRYTADAKAYPGLRFHHAVGLSKEMAEERVKMISPTFLHGIAATWSLGPRPIPAMARVSAASCCSMVSISIGARPASCELPL